MKRFLLSLGAAAVALAATTAYAAEIQGVVKILDTKDHRITLASGKVYSFATKLDVSDVKPGATVKIVYTPVDPQSFWATTLGLAGSASAISVAAPGTAGS